MSVDTKENALNQQVLCKNTLDEAIKKKNAKCELLSKRQTVINRGRGVSGSGCICGEEMWPNTDEPASICQTNSNHRVASLFWWKYSKSTLTTCQLAQWELLRIISWQRRNYKVLQKPDLRVLKSLALFQTAYNTLLSKAWCSTYVKWVQ